MRRVLRVDVLNPLFGVSGNLRIDTTYLEALQRTLASAEKVLVRKEVVLALVGAGKVEHDVHHLFCVSPATEAGRTSASGTFWCLRSSTTAGMAFWLNFWYRRAYRIASRSFDSTGMSGEETIDWRVCTMSVESRAEGTHAQIGAVALVGGQALLELRHCEETLCIHESRQLAD